MKKRGLFLTFRIAPQLLWQFAVAIYFIYGAFYVLSDYRNRLPLELMLRNEFLRQLRRIVSVMHQNIVRAALGMK